MQEIFLTLVVGFLRRLFVLLDCLTWTDRFYLSGNIMSPKSDFFYLYSEGLVIGIVATILLITTLSFGSLGIHIAKQWPEPSCCCYTGTLGNGRMAGCHDLARINLAFFIVQIIVAVLFVFMAIFTAGPLVAICFQI